MKQTIADPSTFRHVQYLWDADHAAALDPVERLVYRSNLLGRDLRITNTGGGNTSAKIVQKDPLTGQEVEVLWVKGSGGDLRTSTKANFASLDLRKLLGLRSIYNADPNKGPKSSAEDRMVGLFPHCTFNLNPRASSIDTPLHGFLPPRHVDHMHPNSVIAIAACRHSKELTAAIFGDELGWVPWLRPGFELGLLMQRELESHPGRKGLVMGQHGLINWADDDRTCYERTLSIIERAAAYLQDHDRGQDTFGGAKYDALTASQRDAVLCELLPWLRGQVSQQARQIGTVQTDPNILQFVNSRDAARLAELGTSCPDHFLRTKIKPLYVEWDPLLGDVADLKSRLSAGLTKYREDYAQYYDRCKHTDSPPMRDPNPTVILIPGIGMIAWGKSKSESRVTAEFYNCAVEVMRGAESVDEYVALPQQEAFDIEYWLLEEAKLKRMPPEREFARRIVAVIGAGSGIGKAVARQLAEQGAQLVCADLDGSAAEATAREIVQQYGEGIGVAGTGISACGPAIGVQVDATDPKSIAEMIRTTLLAYGGVDHLVITAGIFVPPDRSGRITTEQWKRTFDVNVLGAYQAVDAARPALEHQKLPGSIVITTSVNAVVAKKGSLAYDASKAAANHLVRELAMELAPTVRVNGVAPATVVQGSTMFPRDRVISSLSKYQVPFDSSSDDETLRGLLAAFYAERTLTRSAITPDDQANAIEFLISDRSAKITGQIVTVDGGLPEAFLR